MFTFVSGVLKFENSGKNPTNQVIFFRLVIQFRPKRSKPGPVPVRILDPVAHCNTLIS